MTPSIHDTAVSVTSTNCSDKLDKRYLQTIRCTANMGTSQYCDVMIVGVSRALSRVYQKSMDGVGAPTDGRPPQGASTGTQGGHHSGPNDTGHRQQRLLRLAGWPLRGLSRCNSSLPPLLPPPLRLRLVRLLFSVLLTRGPNLSTTAKALLRSCIRSQYEISGGTAAQNRFYAPIKNHFPRLYRLRFSIPHPSIFVSGVGIHHPCT